MKHMKTAIAATVALAACAGTQLFAQNIKQDTITFALTVMQQGSVSTSPSVANYGNFSTGPAYYKTVTKKMTQLDILKAISYVQHGRNAGYYTSQASLVLVQGELGGFWNIDDALAQSYEDFNQYFTGWTAPTNKLTGTFNLDGTDSAFYDNSSSANAAFDPIVFPSGYVGIDDISTFLDNNPDTTVGAGTDSYIRLDTGRHFLPVPAGYATTGEYPVGHQQPWGQIFVKDPGHKDSLGNILCENVTYFFYLEVQECYDCFYLSSYITDATFTEKSGTQTGPPCCTSPSFVLGKGTDKYYLSFSFDNTINNSYLNPATATNVDESGVTNVGYYYEYVGVTGLVPTVGVADGITPDLLTYSDPIRSRLGTASPYETRFTLNGIVTYNWNLTLVNPTDISADFVGTATYAANGYGFIGLVCSLLTGSATFSERIVKDVNCCDDIPWYNSWYGPGSDDNAGYFNPEIDQWDQYPNYNIVGGESYTTHSPAYFFSLPYQNESPLNPGAALTYHGVNDPTATSH
jgi:hypothetical protein